MSMPFAQAQFGIFLTTLMIAMPAQAQSEWNRKLQRLAIVPTPGGPADTYDLDVEWRLELFTPAVAGPRDLGTEVALEINGVETAARVSVVATDNGGANPGVCGPAACNIACGSIDGGGPVSMTCTADGAGDCPCTSPPLTAAFTAQVLTPHDEIMVILYPAPGALPDSDSTDDTGVLTFGSWNRRIQAVSIAPTPGGPAGLYDVTFDWVVELEGQATIDLNVAVDVDVNVNEDSCCQEACCCPQCKCSENGCGSNDECIIWDIQDSDACTVDPDQPCGDVLVNGQTAQLVCDVDTDGCHTPVFTDVVSEVPLQPGDEITVILRPAEGSLPETQAEGDTLATVFAGTDVPTTSGWGLVIMVLTVLTVGAMTLRHRAPAKP